MPHKQTIFKAGNSLAVSIPARVVNRLGLQQGQRVNCESSIEGNKITYHFTDAKQLPLLGSKKIKADDPPSRKASEYKQTD